jgi:hypothetical protein
MELLMKINFFSLAFLLLLPALAALAALAVLTGCGGGKSLAEKAGAGRTQAFAKTTVGTDDPRALLQSLDEIAELERAGSWLAGMALTESGIRENAGDYAGAVAAAYKELSFAYGRGLIQKGDIERGLLNVREMQGEDSVTSETTAAVDAVLAYTRGQWDKAAPALEKLFDSGEEPDGFANWMILSCALEKDGEDRKTAAAYKSIRARYAQFPEYWYRGAKAFSGNVAAEYAENCINCAPKGPFAEECRKILASYTGLKTEEGSAIKTKREIESVISQSVNAGNPELLDSLLPLIALPDNPYTVYAVGALRALTSVPSFRDYFNGKATVTSGRLAERLAYICRG